MITAPDVASDLQAAPPVQQADRRRRLPIVLAIAVVALSGIGLLLLQRGSDDGATAAGISSSADYLQAASPTGIPRIRVWRGESATSLTNGGSIAVTDDLLLAVTVSPYPPTQFDIDVDFAFTRADGAPITDADVSIVWDMVIMGHGPFRTDLQHLGDGHYGAHFDLFMFGPWDLDLEISPSYELPDDLSVSLYVWPE